MSFIEKKWIASRKDAAGNGLTKNELLDIIEKIDAEKSVFRAPYRSGKDRQGRKAESGQGRGRGREPI